MISQATVTSLQARLSPAVSLWENPQENGEEEEEELNTKQQLTKKKKKINGGLDETPLAHRPLPRYYQI